LKLYTQVSYFVIFDFQEAWIDLSFKINAYGLNVISFETWGTETANFANFDRFSFVFTHFAFKTYKTQSLGYFQYFDAFFIVFKCFAAQI
jgi:hypothetical protein